MRWDELPDRPRRAVDSDHPAVQQQGAVDAAVNTEELLDWLGGVDLINQAADGSHGGFPCVSAELQCVDGGAGGLELGPKGGGHSWQWVAVG